MNKTFLFWSLIFFLAPIVVFSKSDEEQEEVFYDPETKLLYSNDSIVVTYQSDTCLSELNRIANSYNAKLDDPIAQIKLVSLVFHAKFKSLESMDLLINELTNYGCIVKAERSELQKEF